MRVILIDWLIVESRQSKIGTISDTPVPVGRCLQCTKSGKPLTMKNEEVELLNIVRGFTARIVVIWLIQAYRFDNVSSATVETPKLIGGAGLTVENESKFGKRK